MTMSYLSRKPCGCLGMAVVDNPEHKRDVAKEIAKAVRLGEIVERVPLEKVRRTMWRCPTHSAKKEGDK